MLVKVTNFCFFFAGKITSENLRTIFVEVNLEHLQFFYYLQKQNLFFLLLKAAILGKDREIYFCQVKPTMHE